MKFIKKKRLSQTANLPLKVPFRYGYRSSSAEHLRLNICLDCGKTDNIRLRKTGSKTITRH